MKKYLGLLGCLWLVACSQSPVDTKPPAPISFKHTLPIHLNAANVSVDDQSPDEQTGNHVESKMPTAPEVSIEDWANDRLQVTGTGTGRVVVAINEASVTTDPLPKLSQFKSVITPVRQQAYHGKISVVIRLYDGVNPLAVAEASVNVTRTKSLKENASPDERTAFYNSLNSELMHSFDDQANAQIRRYFKAYIQ